MLKKTLALAGLTFSLFSNAALIDYGTFTRDKSTGLNWLDLTETAGLSHDYVSSQLGAGGQFEGWQYATLDQTLGFFDSAGGSGFYYYAYNDDSDKNITAAHKLMDLWGAMSTTVSSNGYVRRSYVILDEIANYSHAGDTPGLDYTILSINASTLTNVGQINGRIEAPVLQGAIEGSASSPIFGSALVRAEVIPIPATGWLFISALVGLVGRKRLSR